MLAANANAVVLTEQSQCKTICPLSTIPSVLLAENAPKGARASASKRGNGVTQVDLIVVCNVICNCSCSVLQFFKVIIDIQSMRMSKTVCSCVSFFLCDFGAFA